MLKDEIKYIVSGRQLVRVRVSHQKPYNDICSATWEKKQTMVTHNNGHSERGPVGAPEQGAGGVGEQVTQVGEAHGQQQHGGGRVTLIFSFVLKCTAFIFF